MLKTVTCLSPVRRFDESSESDVENKRVPLWWRNGTAFGRWMENVPDREWLVERVREDWPLLEKHLHEDEGWEDKKQVSAWAGEECLDSTTWERRMMLKEVCQWTQVLWLKMDHTLERQQCGQSEKSRMQESSSIESAISLKKFPSQESSFEVL